MEWIFFTLIKLILLKSNSIVGIKRLSMQLIEKYTTRRSINNYIKCPEKCPIYWFVKCRSLLSGWDRISSLAKILFLPLENNIHVFAQPCNISFIYLYQSTIFRIFLGYLAVLYQTGLKIFEVGEGGGECTHK